MKLIDYLPDNYVKDENSNNYKLLELAQHEIDELKQVFKDIESSRDIDNSEGVTLDKTGKNVLEYRSNRNDEEYRKFIKLKIKANRSHGEIPLLNEVLSTVLAENFEGIEETWNNDLFDNEPAALAVNLKSGDFEVPEELTKRIKSGGVGLSWQINTEGEITALKTGYEKYEFPYNMCGTFLCGTKPYYVTEGVIFETKLQAKTSNIEINKQYLMAGTFNTGRERI